jgi:hypothetical protein
MTKKNYYLKSYLAFLNIIPRPAALQWDVGFLRFMAIPLA